MLGANRDYKTADRRARKKLAIHAQMMNLYIQRDGLTKDQASALALKHMENPQAECDYEQSRRLSGGYAMKTK